MGDSLTRDGPTFGKSRIGFGAQSSYSGSRKSNTTTGGGLASRFQLALSKVIDPTSANPDGTASPRGTDDEDIQEIVNLVAELNQHQDLTVKLSNQSKICNIFQKSSKPQTSLMRKKLDQNL